MQIQASEKFESFSVQTYKEYAAWVLDYGLQDPSTNVECVCNAACTLSACIAAPSPAVLCIDSCACCDPLPVQIPCSDAVLDQCAAHLQSD